VDRKKARQHCTLVAPMIDARSRPAHGKVDRIAEYATPLPMR